MSVFRAAKFGNRKCGDTVVYGKEQLGLPICRVRLCFNDSIPQQHGINWVGSQFSKPLPSIMNPSTPGEM